MMWSSLAWSDWQCKVGHICGSGSLYDGNHPLLRLAQEAPKSWTVDMTTVMLDDNGDPIKDQFDRKPDDPSCSKCRDLTLGNAIAHSLFIVGQDERDVTPEQKWAWAAYAEQIRTDKAASIDHAHGDLIYRRLGKMYSGLVLMRAMPLIDPNRKVPEIK
jgi:hypothetical protein